MKRRETFGPGDLNVQAGFTSNMISGGASEDYDTLKEIEEKVKSNTEDIEQNKTDISLLKENVEFTPRFIGRYNAPWFIDGQGSLTARLVQLQKNVFSLDVNGGGSPCALSSGTNYAYALDLPIKTYNPENNMVPYCSPVRLGTTTEQGSVIGMAGYTDGSLTIQAESGIEYTSLTLANIIIYGELIEEETIG